MEQLEFIRNAGETRRFHTVPVLRQQNVAEHSWHVAMLAHVIYGQESPGITPTFLMACLCHDMAECVVGDLPAPAKRGMGLRWPDFREEWGKMEEAILSDHQLDWQKFLSDEEKRRLKVVDALDGVMYCARERAMGNKLIHTCYRNFAIYVRELLRDCDVPLEPRPKTIDELEWDAYQHAVDMWEQADAS